MNVLADALLDTLGGKITSLATRARLPSAGGFRNFAEAGAFLRMVQTQVMFQRAGWYVGKILKGSRPADLPVEQSTRYELVVNLYKQLTGRDNFRAIGQIVNMDLEGHPELAREPIHAARVAFAFWDASKCSPLADRGDLEGITRKVNGPAKLGLAERREATLRAMDIWPE